MKPRKSILKRFKVTKTGKVLKRAAGQAHFNGREPGKVTRAKRRDIGINSKKIERNIKQLLV